MKINKSLLLVAASALFVACSRKLTVNEAKKFIETNYSGKTVKSVTKINLSQDFSETKDEEWRTYANDLCKDQCAKYDIEYKDNSLKFAYELTEGDEFDLEKIPAERIMEASGLDDPIEEGTTLELTAKGKELTLTYITKEDNVVCEKNIATVNENGQNRYLEHYANRDGLISISKINYTF